MKKDERWGIDVTPYYERKTFTKIIEYNGSSAFAMTLCGMIADNDSEEEEIEEEVEEDQDDFTNRMCENRKCKKEFDLTEPHYYDEEDDVCYCCKECFEEEEEEAPTAKSIVASIIANVVPT
jgi:hypothetical protein